MLARLKADLIALSDGDDRVLWALRRKLTKELIHLERNTPAARNRLKAVMWTKQNGVCAICTQPMPRKGSELDRFEAYLGYVESNVRLVHHECHISDQAAKGHA